MSLLEAGFALGFVFLVALVIGLALSGKWRR